MHLLADAAMEVVPPLIDAAATPVRIDTEVEAVETLPEVEPLEEEMTGSGMGNWAKEREKRERRTRVRRKRWMWSMVDGV